MEQIVIDSTID